MICAAGRTGDHAALPALRALAEHRDVHVRDYAAWACLTIAPEAVSRRVWKVDPVRGDDAAAPGGSIALRTVSAALRRTRPGDTVLLSPGIYRETIAPWLGGTASAPLTIDEMARALESCGTSKSQVKSAVERLFRAELIDPVPAPVR